jgi:hypothetical protein
MEVDWSSLSTSLTLALSNDVLKTIGFADEKQLSSMVYSLGKLNTKWSFLSIDLKKKIQICLQNKIETMHEQQLAYVFNGFLFF